MKFLLDHDVPEDLTYLLQELGHEFLRLRDVLPQEAADSLVLAPRRLPHCRRNRRRYFRWTGARWKRTSVEGCRTIAARIRRPGRMRSAHAPATMRSAVSDHGPRAAGTGKSGDRRQQVEKQDGQVTHDPILTTS